MIIRLILVLACIVVAMPAQAQEEKAIDAGYLVQVQPGLKRYFWTNGQTYPGPRLDAARPMSCPVTS